MKGLKSLVGFSRVVLIALIFAFLGQSTGPVLADTTSALFVSYLSVDTTSSAAGTMVQTKKYQIGLLPRG